MKRILFMHQTSAIGGGSYCLLSIVKSLNRDMVHPIICLPSFGPLCNELISNGVEFIIFKDMEDIPYNQPLFLYRSIKKYYKINRTLHHIKTIIKKHDIDVLYLNNMMLYKYLKPAKKCGCKTIIHIREHWPLNEHQKQLQWARDAIYKYADELIAINDYSASMFPLKKVTIVHDWIDMSDRYEYLPMSELLNEDATGLKVYLYTGGNQIIKGLLEVVKAFNSVVKDPNARLLIMGKIVYKEKSIIKKHIKDLLSHLGKKFYYKELFSILDSDKRIVCIDSTYKIQHIYQQSYCMLSYFTIPHANLALAEGIINGLVCIAAKTEESIEYSKEGDLCLLFEFGNYEDFKNKLIQIDSNHKYVKDNINKYSNVIAHMFDKEQNAFILQQVLYSI